jgi:hypothetical protein
LELEQFGISTVQTEEAEAVFRTRIKIAEEGVKAAEEAHAKLLAVEQQASDAAFAAARAARDAREAAETTTRELRLARRFIRPITMFVSRRTGRVYLRQGFEPLAEEPVVVREPDRPLGTHVYTAMEETSDPSGLRWVAVSVPTTGGLSRRARAKGDAGEQSSATEALDRLQVPAEVMALMSERVWPGASIIVSDFGLGETGEGTGFVIRTD